MHEKGERPLYGRVIFASALGTVFEWYDFYLYGTLAVFFSALFFPPGNDTAAFLASLATFGAGFAVRPLGALVFGRIGDLVGRKYTFLITIVVMGLSTALVGILPTYAQIGIWAPILLVTLRLAQGLALGGEYGGAATYVAEHAPAGKRGYFTSWIQTTATLGFFLSLAVILGCRLGFGEEAFKAWGWRIPFLLSVVLLAVSVYIRLRLQESPVFVEMKAAGRLSRAPLRESFGEWRNARIVLLALLGATAGQGVVWYTGQFYALFFLQNTLKLDYQTAYLLIAAALAIGTPFFVVFGRLSDRVGRKRIMVAGCLLAALTYIPIFKGLTLSVNPALAEFEQRAAVTVAGEDCHFRVFAKPKSDCDRARDFLTKAGVNYESLPAVPGGGVVTTIAGRPLRGFEEAAFREALDAAGYPAAPDPGRMDLPATLALLVVLMLYVTMVYGPIAAFAIRR
jgi:MFS family permease